MDRTYYTNSSPVEGQTYIAPEWVNYSTKQRWVWDHTASRYDEVLCAEEPLPPDTLVPLVFIWLDDQDISRYVEAGGSTLVNGDLITLVESPVGGGKVNLVKSFVPSGGTIGKVRLRHTQDNLSAPGQSYYVVRPNIYQIKEEFASFLTNVDSGSPLHPGAYSIFAHLYVYPEVAITGLMDPPGFTGYQTRLDLNQSLYALSSGLLEPSLATTSSREAFISLKLNRSTSDPDNLAVVKLTSSGAIAWQRQIVSSARFAMWTQVTSAVDATGNFYVLATETQGVHLFKFDTSGNLVWQKRLAFSGPNSLMYVGLSYHNNALYVSCSNGTSGTRILKLDLSGALVKALCVQMPLENPASDYWAYGDQTLAFTPDGKVLGTDILYRDDPYYEDQIVFKLDFDNNALDWVRRIKDIVENYLWVYGLTTDGTYVATVHENYYHYRTILLPVSDGGAEGSHEDVQITRVLGATVSDITADVVISTPTYSVTSVSAFDVVAGSYITDSSGDIGVNAALLTRTSL